MSKYNFAAPPTQVYQEFKIVMQSLASTVDQLQPFDFEALIRKVQAFHQETGTFSRAFYSVANMQTGDFSWQFGLSTALGASPRDFSLVEFLERLHPDYLPMFRFWAMVVNEAAYSMALGEGVYDYVYHIALPLRREDHTYHWYMQHSFAMQSDAAGHYVNHFNFYDYGGQWHAHNRAPFLPFVINYNQPSPDLEKIMYDLAATRIREFFTRTEQLLLEWYMKGEPIADKLRMQPHTLHEHNSNILRKTTAILLTDFRSARDAALLLLACKLWKISE